MSEAGPVTLELLGQILRDVQRELREMRRERRVDMELGWKAHRYGNVR